jgi:tetratricopeptide (TPR) repeat protein
MRKFIFTISLIALFTGKLQSQNLNLIKSYIKGKDYEKALTMLKPLYESHPSDVNIGWLYALTLHKNGNVDESQKVYWQLAADFPYNYDIKIDRINKLMEAGRLDEAEYLVQTTIKNVPEYYRFLSLLSLTEIAWWRGDYDKALTHVDSALAIYPTEKSAMEWQKKIIERRSNYLIAGLQYTTDDQPLDVWRPSVKTDFYFNSHFSAGLDAEYPYFSYDSIHTATPEIRAHATYRFIPATTDISLNAGVFSSAESGIMPVFGISIGHKFTHKLQARLSYQRQAYTVTKYAVEQPLMHARTYFHLMWKNSGGMQVKALAANHKFEDTPYSYYTLAAWALSPALKWQGMSFQAGYGFNYSNSDGNAFVSQNSIEEIQNSWTEDMQITGGYDPVFTPSNQSVHTLIGLIKLKVSRAGNLLLKGG